MTELRACTSIPYTIHVPCPTHDVDDDDDVANLENIIIFTGINWSEFLLFHSFTFPTLCISNNNADYGLSMKLITYLK